MKYEQDYSHTHCWNQEDWACGITPAMHTQCCLCDVKYPSVAKLPQKEESKCTCLKGEYGIFQTCDNCFVKHINSTPLEEEVTRLPITDWEIGLINNWSEFAKTAPKELDEYDNEIITNWWLEKLRHQKELSTKEEREMIVKEIEKFIKDCKEVGCSIHSLQTLKSIINNL